MLHSCLWLWCGCSICQLVNLTLYQNDHCYENFTVPPHPLPPHPPTPPHPETSMVNLLTKTRKLTNLDLLCFFALRAVLSVLNVRWCPVTPRRLANGFHKLLFNSLYSFLSLQAQWFVYVPPGLTLKNSIVICSFLGNSVQWEPSCFILQTRLKSKPVNAVDVRSRCLFWDPY